MIEDPIVQEVRRLRQEHAAKFNYDLKAIFADLKRTEEARDPQQAPLLTPEETRAEVDSAQPEPRLARFGR